MREDTYHFGRAGKVKDVCPECGREVNAVRAEEEQDEPIYAGTLIMASPSYLTLFVEPCGHRLKEFVIKADGERRGYKVFLRRETGMPSDQEDLD